MLPSAKYLNEKVDYIHEKTREGELQKIYIHSEYLFRVKPEMHEYYFLSCDCKGNFNTNQRVQSKFLKKCLVLVHSEKEDVKNETALIKF